MTVLGRLSPAELLAVVRACSPLRLPATMDGFFRPFLVRYFGAAAGTLASLTEDELRALYASVRYLLSLAN